jgi:hypothetical protein
LTLAYTLQYQGALKPYFEEAFRRIQGWEHPVDTDHWARLISAISTLKGLVSAELGNAQRWGVLQLDHSDNPYMPDSITPAMLAYLHAVALANPHVKAADAEMEKQTKAHLIRQPVSLEKVNEHLQAAWAALKDVLP